VQIRRNKKHLFGPGVFLVPLALMLVAPQAAAAADESNWQEQPAVDTSSVPGNAQLGEVEQRLIDNLSAETLANFNLFIYIDKAEDGAFAQRMVVFEKTDTGSLVPLYDWRVSTGRERDEIDPHGRRESTATPRGFFEFDPKRMYIDHSSSQWDEAMPYAMFFSWKPGGHDTGLAIHGTPDENYDELGSPASAGCIRLSMENARVLFDLVHAQGGPAPKLAYLNDSSVSSEGLLLHDPEGRLQLTDGYSALVLVDDYAPGERVSSLY
jgi:lipoprotein-anchoring transpeptidase ErfK/SrfK